jgi:hypothetical protein
MFKSEKFDLVSASLAAEVLAKILARRTHVKVVFGEERRVSGTLGFALNLPAIRKRLESRSIKQRERGLDEFKALWDTLSSRTCNSVLKEIGWYDPTKLEWDDQRSNRRPDLSEDS